ncbi:TPA: tyrosine-type recombinase/integrase [Burkholderia multivorans]|nr:tyrosine-type recombinase/integrase [Burkholderia multivorans]HDR9840845.1 tyrosine-type recombinase/integrase [Burkholderia multivorans]HDR9847367.1 tyrosine-type recombinase/integrase [Burkholderia multivorans]HDR9853781.1 tyrosine-type recombinase/integrase [Burkholderia multivorans]
MASITKHKNQWRAQVYVRAIRESKIFRTKREAEAWAATREIALREQETLTPAQRHTVRELFEKYSSEVSEQKRGAIEETARIRAFIREFPDIADLTLDKIDSAVLGRWRDARLKGGYIRPNGEEAQAVTRSTVQRDIAWMNAAFGVARKEWKWLEHNPFFGMRQPGQNPPRERRIHPIEVKRLCRRLGYVSGRPPETKGQEVALIFLIALRTAMRAGEIKGLGKTKLNLEKRVATVEHKMQYKTGKPRQVPLSKQAVRLLRAVADRDRCFTVTSTTLDMLFRKARDSLLIEDLHFHDSRAEALTRFAKRVDVMTLAKISGHQDLRILQRVYYRETAEDIAARL